MTNTVTNSGPLFNGQAANQARALESDVVAAVSKIAAAEIGIAFRGHAQNPTGHYVSTIKINSVSTDSATVDAMNNWYGPWLTGTGSRNATSSFKGYPHFPEATRSTNAQASKVAGSAVSIRVKAMN
tara:strand:- start:1468 stop:1848 length:381 start_codon:yes stop_codon:yes gene_type:complete